MAAPKDSADAATLLCDEELELDREENLSDQLTILNTASYRNHRWVLVAIKDSAKKKRKERLFSSDSRFGSSLAFSSKQEAECQKSRDTFATSLLRKYPTFRVDGSSGSGGSARRGTSASSSSATAVSPLGDSSAQDPVASAGGASSAAGGKGGGTGEGREKRRKLDGGLDRRVHNGGNSTRPKHAFHRPSDETIRAERLSRRNRRIARRRLYHDKFTELPAQIRQWAEEEMCKLDRYAQDRRSPNPWSFSKIVRQAERLSQRQDRIEAKLAGARESLHVLETASRAGMFEALVEPVDDPGYRSRLTTFTLEHVVVQSLALLHYYTGVVDAYEHQLGDIKDIFTFTSSAVYAPKNVAYEKAADAALVSTKTVYRWQKDFELNGNRFSESRQGKAMRDWILDNPAMQLEAKAWLRKQVRRKAKKNRGVFQIRDFQEYLNTTLLPRWKVAPWRGAPKSSVKDFDGESDFLQITESTALAWAHRLGLSWARKTKTYYVDGHDRKDVLAHRAFWLEKELELELRQYLFVQLPLRVAKLMEQDSNEGGGDQGNAALAPAPAAGAGGGGGGGGGSDGDGGGSGGDGGKETKFSRLLRLAQGQEVGGATELEKALQNEMVYRYWGDGAGKPAASDDPGEWWVELHVDLLPASLRHEKAAVVNGFNMGGRLSVRFPQGERPILKAGQDETIFKAYDAVKSSWTLDDVKHIQKKSEGKGNMKSLFMDEATGSGGNNIPAEKMAAFQEARKPGFRFENPALVHWEYGKAGAAIGQGYWTNEDMVALVPEWIEMMEFMLPGHQFLINVDYSSNHSAFAPNARTLSNMRVTMGGERKVGTETVAAADAEGRQVEKEAMPVFDSYELTAEDIGPRVPPKWRSKVQAGKKLAFAFKGSERPFYAKDDMTAADCRGKAIGKREIAHRLGWWKDGMTEKGGRKKTAAAAAAAFAPAKWKKGDLVARKEPGKKAGDPDVIELYRVVSVPVTHSDAKSDTDIIRCQWFERSKTGLEEEEGSATFTLRNAVWDDESYTANTMSWVDPKTALVVEGSLSAKVKCVLELDLKAYYEAFVPAVVVLDKDGGEDDDGDGGAALDDSDDDGDSSGDDDDGDGGSGGDGAGQGPPTDQAGGGGIDDEIDQTSLNSVLGALPMFKNVKSLLQEIVEERGHILFFSSKYHAECAGQGIEYCFGRAKWWFRKHNRMSTAGLKKNSALAFGLDVLPISLVRKYARKNRDYHRVYRAGVSGTEADGAVKKCKTHRSALDSHYAFIQEDS